MQAHCFCNMVRALILFSNLNCILLGHSDGLIKTNIIRGNLSDSSVKTKPLVYRFHVTRTVISAYFHSKLYSSIFWGYAGPLSIFLYDENK